MSYGNGDGAKREPPFSRECERAVLGGLLLDSSLIATTAPHLPVEAFRVEQHRLIYAGLLELSGEADLRTLQSYLEQRGEFEKVGGLDYLTALDLDLPDISRLEVYVALLLELWQRRRLIELGFQIAQQARDKRRKPDETLGEALVALQGLAATSAGGAGFRAADDILASYIEEVEEQMILGAAAREPGMRFGVPDIDSLTGGFERGKMWILAGYPGTGKTSAMLQMITEEALVYRRHVAVFSLEMGEADLLLRLVSQELQIPSRRLRKRQVTAVELQQLRALYSRFKAAGTIHVDQQGAIDTRTIGLRVRRLASKVPLSGVMIDYLTELGGDDKVSDKAKRLRDLFKETNVKGCVLAQLNRSAAKERRRPRLDDLREGGEEPADGVLALYREKVPQADGNEWMSPDGEALILKNRFGEYGVARYTFEKTTQRMIPYGHSVS